MRKTEKVLDVWDLGMHITCIKHNLHEHPYRVYANWYNQGYHKKLIGKGDTITAVLGFVREAFVNYATENIKP